MTQTNGSSRSLASTTSCDDGERQGVLAVLSLLGALTTLVLVVAAANLGNLVMSRATGRVRELGVRMALGARRARIVRQLVIESVPLALMGALGSLGFALGGGDGDRGARRLSSVPGFQHPSGARVDVAVALALLSLRRGRIAAGVEESRSSI